MNFEATRIGKATSKYYKEEPKAELYVIDELIHKIKRSMQEELSSGCFRMLQICNHADKNEININIIGFTRTSSHG